MQCWNSSGAAKASRAEYSKGFNGSGTTHSRAPTNLALRRPDPLFTATRRLSVHPESGPRGRADPQKHGRSILPDTRRHDAGVRQQSGHKRTS